MQQLPLHYPALDIIEYALVKGEKALYIMPPTPFLLKLAVLKRQ